MKNAPVDTPESTQAPRAPQVAVVDIPLDSSEAETVALLEEHSEGMYLMSVVPWPRPGVGARAFFRKLVQQAKREAGADSPERARENAVADAILRKYPNLKPGKIADKLAAKGIVWHPLAISSRRRHLELTDIATDANREA